VQAPLALPPVTAIGELVQYVVAPWLTLNVIVPALIALDGIVDGRSTFTKALNVRFVSPGCRLASNVWVLVAAGLTARTRGPLDTECVASPA
jgi:hypothetical protein